MGSPVFLPPHVELLAAQAFPGGAHSTTDKFIEIVPCIIKQVQRVSGLGERFTAPCFHPEILGSHS